MDRQPRTAPSATPPLWLVVLAVGCIVAISMGRNQVMGLFLIPVTGALDVGRETFGLAMAISQLTLGLGAPIAGALVDKHGAGRVVVACALSTIAGLWLIHEAQGSTALIISGVLMGIGVCGTGISALVGTIGRAAPPEQRTSAIASIGMAAGIGTFVAYPYIHLFMEWLGWKGALVVLMATTALMIPIAWTISGRPTPGVTLARDQTLWEAIGEAFRHPSFILLTAGFFVCGFHVSFVGTHLPAYATDLGLPSWVAPIALSVVGIVNIAGTWLAGQSGRYVEKRVGLALIYLCRAAIFLGFLFLPMTPVTMIVLCSMLGLVWLATIPLTSGLVAIFFGTKWMSTLYGFVFLSHQVGSFLGVWLGGRLFDVMRSYETMWWLSVALGLAAAALNWPIKERPVARAAPAAS